METAIKASMPWGYSNPINDPYQNLAIGIVEQAVRDYVRLIRKLWKKNLDVLKKRRLMLEKVELEEFFYSDWYAELTDINPNKLLAQCKVYAREKEKKAIASRNKAKIKKLLKEQDGNKNALNKEEQKHETGENITRGADGAAASE